ncbi:MAG: hypothetical protein ABIA04_11140 [Pseudomonadota bacterium]
MKKLFIILITLIFIISVSVLTTSCKREIPGAKEKAEAAKAAKKGGDDPKPAPAPPKDDDPEDPVPGTENKIAINIEGKDNKWNVTVKINDTEAEIDGWKDEISLPEAYNLSVDPAGLAVISLAASTGEPFKIKVTDCDGCSEGVEIMLTAVTFTFTLEKGEGDAEVVNISSEAVKAADEEFDVTKIAGKPLKFYIEGIEAALDNTDPIIDPEEDLLAVSINMINGVTDISLKVNDEEYELEGWTEEEFFMPEGFKLWSEHVEPSETYVCELITHEKKTL